MSSRQKAGLAQ